jgi:Secretion system C-terminal sorting domain
MHRFTTILFYVWGLMLSNNTNAQVSITNSYFITANDTLKTATALPQFLANVQVSAASATAQTWDYSFLRSAANSTAFQTQRYLAATDTGILREFPGAELVRELGGGRFAVYNVTSTKFELIGYNKVNLGSALNLPVVARFIQPVLERRAPLAYNSTNRNSSSYVVAFPSSIVPDTILALLPIRPDSIRIRYQTTRNDQIDAFGTISIPGLTKEVLRERRYEETEFKLEAKLNPLPWIDITNIVLQNGLQRPRDTTIRYYFWANNIKEPLAVITTDVSQKVTGVDYKFVTINTSIPKSVYTEGGPDMSISPNPTRGSVVLDLKNVTPGTYYVSFFDLRGKFLLAEKRQLFDKEEKWRIDLSDLPNGTYSVQLKGANGSYILKKCVVQK